MMNLDKLTTFDSNDNLRNYIMTNKQLRTKKIKFNVGSETSQGVPSFGLLSSIVNNPYEERGNEEKILSTKAENKFDVLGKKKFKEDTALMSLFKRNFAASLSKAFDYNKI